MAIQVNSNFDSGNIEVLKAENAKDIQLKIRKDTKSDFLQWFHFKVSGISGKKLKININNASETSYPTGWPEYKACASYDRQTWFRVDTSYDGKALTIDHETEHDTMYFAYFAPYSYEMHLDLVAACEQSALCGHEVLGQTVEGRDIDMLKIGEEMYDELKIWVIARQHPGESMAEWFVQGFLTRLLDQDDAVSRKLLERAVFYVVPNVNPDGSIHGNLRSNAAGANLNREWDNPSLEQSPEVYHILKKMNETGLDLLLDVHGDEDIPYNFISANEGIPGYSDAMHDLEENFKARWEESCPDFQTKNGYPKVEKGKADMSICTNQIASRFDTLALTIEMPFIDNHDLPDPDYGWSAERSEKLGSSVLDPVLYILDQLS